METTPIYDEAFNAACDHAIETGQDELLDSLEEMDAATRPVGPAPRAVHSLTDVQS